MTKRRGAVMATRRKRLLELVRKYGITRKRFIEKTPYSGDQYQYWFGRGEKFGRPSVHQLAVICNAFDWSPTWIFFGEGPELLSELSMLFTASEAHNVAIENGRILRDILKKVS